MNTEMKHHHIRGLPSLSLTTALLIALGVGAPLRAQGDPGAEARKIVEAVDREMQEIDRLLRESARPPESEGSATTETARQRVGQTRESQTRVVDGIDKLLDELQKMAQQQSSSSSSSSSSQQDQQQGQPQSGNQRQRQESQTPDMVDQAGQQQQEQGQQQQGQQQQDGQQQQGSQQDGQRSDGDQDPRSGGENVRSGERGEDGSERVDRAGDDGGWGRLPPYARFLHSRGGVPEVPARYRRLYEAWQKRVNDRASQQPPSGRR